MDVTGDGDMTEQGGGDSGPGPHSGAGFWVFPPPVRSQAVCSLLPLPIVSFAAGQQCLPRIPGSPRRWTARALSPLNSYSERCHLKESKSNDYCCFTGEFFPLSLRIKDRVVDKEHELISHSSRQCEIKNQSTISFVLGKGSVSASEVVP